jgi:hypothetical protein
MKGGIGKVRMEEGRTRDPHKAISQSAAYSM